MTLSNGLSSLSFADSCFDSRDTLDFPFFIEVPSLFNLKDEMEASADAVSALTEDAGQTSTKLPAVWLFTSQDSVIPSKQAMWPPTELTVSL